MFGVLYYLRVFGRITDQGNLLSSSEQAPALGFDSVDFPEFRQDDAVVFKALGPMDRADDDLRVGRFRSDLFVFFGIVVHVRRAGDTLSEVMEERFGREFLLAGPDAEDFSDVREVGQLTEAHRAFG